MASAQEWACCGAVKRKSPPGSMAAAAFAMTRCCVDSSSRNSRPQETMASNERWKKLESSVAAHSHGAAGKGFRAAPGPGGCGRARSCRERCRPRRRRSPTGAGTPWSSRCRTPGRGWWTWGEEFGPRRRRWRRRCLYRCGWSHDRRCTRGRCVRSRWICPLSFAGSATGRA